MAGFRKPIYKKWWFWLIVLGIILLLYGLIQAGSNDGDNDLGAQKTTGRATASPSPAATVTVGTSPTPTKQAQQQIEFSNTVVKNTFGITSVYGEVKNNDTKAHSFTLKASFYDGDGKLLGTASGAVNDLNGGDTKVFTAIATEDFSNAASHKVQVDTVISSESNKAIPVTFSNIITKTEFGITTVEGEVKNNDTKPHSFTIAVGFYDSNNKLLGVASGAINDLAAGDTKTFTAIGAEDYSQAVTTKVQLDTLIE